MNYRIHSSLYEEADNSVWTDRKYDEVAKQLTNIQKEHTTMQNIIAL
nr:MAG TPA: hypothetical protein [Caudoviricetes sp.]